MAVTDRTVAVELLAKVTGYTAGTDAAAASTNTLADAMTRAAAAQVKLEGAQRTGTTAAAAAARASTTAAAAQRKQLDALTTVGKGFLTFGAVAGVGFGLAVKASLDFNKQMALVATLAHVSGAPLTALSNAALNVGQKFGYTATQVAQAEAELIKAGLSTSQVLGGALVGSLTLAAAAQTDVGTATELAVSAMTQFELKASSVPHIADLLASGADKALGSAVDLGMGLTQVGTTAHQFGFSLDETVGVLAEFAQSGQIGSRAGTELNQAFLQLAKTTPESQAVLDKYGISLYDAQGNTKSLADFSDNLHSSLVGLTTQQRNTALATIFGSRAIRAANILYAGGGEAVRLWTAKVNDAGFATQQATGKLDSLAGDLQKLKAAFETGLIETGDEATSSLRGVVQGLTDVIHVYDDLNPATKSVVFNLTAAATVTGLLGGAALIGIPKIVAFQEALAALAKTAQGTTVALGETTAAEGAAGSGGFLAKGASKVLGGGAGALGALGLPVAGGIALFSALAASKSQDAADFQKQVQNLVAHPAQLAQQQALLRSLQAQQANTVAHPTALSGLGSSTVAVGGKSFTSTNSDGSDLGARIQDLKKLTDAATAAANKTKKAAADAAKSNDALVTSYSLVGNSIVQTTFDVTTFDHQLTNLSHAFDVQGFTDQLTEGFKNLAKQVKANGSAVKGNSAAALANRDALRQQYATAVNIIKAYAEQVDGQGHLVHSADQVKAKTKQVTDQFVTQAGKAGIVAGKVKGYVDKLATVPGLVNTDITTKGLGAAVTAAGQLAAYLHSIDGKTFSAQVNAQVNFQGGSGVPGIGIRAPGHQPFTGGTIRPSGVSLYSVGGSVFGGMPGRDTVGPVFLDNGEEVTRKDRANKFRPLLKLINNAPGLAGGGTVGSNLSDIFSLISGTNSKGKNISSTLGAQFSSAIGHTTKLDGTFIANLDTLAAKGFGFLAMQLLDSGDSNAKAIAAQAVKWSSSHLRVAQAGLQKSAAQQTQLGLLPAELAITSALKSGKSPTLASIAAATGLDPSDLQAGLIAMQKSLRGNKNAAALLSGLNSTGVYSQSSWGQTTASAGPQFTVVIPKASSNPYSTGEKIAMGAQRVLSLSTGNRILPRW